MTQADERTEEVEVEEDKSKNCGHRHGKRGIETEETEQEGEKIEESNKSPMEERDRK